MESLVNFALKEKYARVKKLRSRLDDMNKLIEYCRRDVLTEEQLYLKLKGYRPFNKKERALWGTIAAHIKNMVTGVTVGFKKELEINGVGFRVAMQGKDLKMEVGFSHSVIYKVPAGAVVSVEKNIIKIESFDIELLGKVAAEIRGIKRPEPYKGKGIKYIDEVVRHKAGKAAAKAAA